MAKSAPHQPEPTTPQVKNRTLRLTAAGYRVTDPPPGRRPAPRSVIQEFAEQHSLVTDHLVAAIGILTQIGYTVGGAAEELIERINVAAAVAHQREREEAQA